MKLPTIILILLSIGGLIACRGDEGMSVTLTQGENHAPLADAEVALMFENPPGGVLRRKTDARGLLRIPAQYKGLRVMIGTECDEKNACERVSPPHLLDGDSVTIEIGGGLNLHP